MHHPYFRFTNGGAVPPPVIVLPPHHPSGGHPFIGRYRERREFYQSAIPIPVAQVIESVAARQLQDLELPRRTQALQLQRALKLKSIQYETRYFEALTQERELLIEIEIGERLRTRLLNDDIDLLMTLAASV